jgi:nucleotide-binding universal stress UspA family protein
MEEFNHHHLTRGLLATPDRILVATDLTDTDTLIPHAIAQARTYGARLTLVHAVAPLCTTSSEEAVIRYAEQANVIHTLRTKLLEQAREVEALGITCDAVVHTGHAGEVILEELNYRDATRLIMGTHGRGKLGQFVLGSVAHELMQNAEIPVFVVGPHARATTEHVAPRKILHPVSLAGNFRESFCVANDIARKHGAELTLLHVLGRSSRSDRWVSSQMATEWAQDGLDRLQATAEKKGPPIQVCVSTGKLGEEILKTANTIGAHWIVLGTSSESRGWTFRDTAAFRVLAEAECPVLTVHREPLQRKTVSVDRGESEVDLRIPG